MSSYAHCKRGGQDGILTDTGEQYQLSKELGTRFLDEFIPIPKVALDTQVALIQSDTCCTPETSIADISTDYWENENGAHGWCCNKCGRVKQWG